MMFKDILKLDGISAWLATVTAAKSMLCGFRKWRDDTNEKLHVIWTLKIVDRWYETLQAMEDQLLDNDMFWSQLPPWAQDAFSGKELERIDSLEDCNKATELHTALLLAASQQLYLIAKRGAGQHNTSQIRRWFESLKLAKKLSLCSQASQHARDDLDAITMQYHFDEGAFAVQENGANKLHHDMLLIHIAHMVNFACAPTRQGSQRKINCSPEELRSWGVCAGKFHSTHLKWGKQGSCIGDICDALGDMNDFAENDFAMIKVPTHQLQLNSGKCPIILALHQEILERMAAAIHVSQLENPDDNQVGSFRFSALHQTAVQLLLNTNAKLSASKKELTHRLTNRTSDTRYEPNRPKRLMNDVFIMGEESYHFIFTTEGSPTTPTKRRRDSSRDHTDGTSPYAKLGRLASIPNLRL